jgi:ribosomal protein S18 acetylase RimI-like enzyme
MFATGSLARRIERAEASLIADCAAAAGRRGGEQRVFMMPIRGGVAAFVEPASPVNKVAGLGFHGLPEDEELATIEAAYAERGCPVVVELSSFADPLVGRLLTRRGYELIGYENVSAKELQPDAPAAPAPTGDSLTIKRVGEAESTAWLDAVTTAFLTPDTYDGLPSHETYDRGVIERATSDMATAEGFERYVAYRNGELAGGASFRSFGGVAQLCGSATLPQHRRRGIQTALLQHRLDEACRRECDVAVVTTQPGSKSQQNVQRSGFAVLYVRAVLMLPVSHRS